MIIEKKNRREKLVESGVLIDFLDAIDNTKEFEGLGFANYPDSAYWYLAGIYPIYEIFMGYDVTPIYDGGNGDTFYVLLSNDEEIRFVYFGLEDDAIYNDYGNNFMLMLIDFLIDCYEFSTEASIESLSEYGKKIGFPKSAELFYSLETADKDNLRGTLELDKQWRKENVRKFL